MIFEVLMKLVAGGEGLVAIATAAADWIKLLLQRLEEVDCFDLER